MCQRPEVGQLRDRGWVPLGSVPGTQALARLMPQKHESERLGSMGLQPHPHQGGSQQMGPRLFPSGPPTAPPPSPRHSTLGADYKFIIIRHPVALRETRGGRLMSFRALHSCPSLPRCDSAAHIAGPLPDAQAVLPPSCGESDDQIHRAGWAPQARATETAPCWVGGVKEPQRSYRQPVSVILTDILRAHYIQDMALRCADR